MSKSSPDFRHYVIYTSVMPLEASRGGGGFNSKPCPTFTFSFKKKMEKNRGKNKFLSK